MGIVFAEVFKKGLALAAFAGPVRGWGLGMRLCICMCAWT